MLVAECPACDFEAIAFRTGTRAQVCSTSCTGARWNVKFKLSAVSSGSQDCMGRHRGPVKSWSCQSCQYITSCWRFWFNLARHDDGDHLMKVCCEPYLPLLNYIKTPCDLTDFWIHSNRYLGWNFRTAIIYICFVLQRFFHSMRLYSCRLKRWCICTGALHNVLLVLQILPSLAVSVMDLVSVGAAGLEPTVPSNVVVVPRIHAGAGFCKWWFECHSLQLEVPSPSFKLFLIFSWGSGHGLCEEDGSCTCEGGWVGQVINCTATNIWSWGQLIRVESK
jgi:hypothetical protein